MKRRKFIFFEEPLAIWSFRRPKLLSPPVFWFPEPQSDQIARRAVCWTFVGRPFTHL